MIINMEKTSASSSRELAQRLYDKNIELENRRRKAAQARVPSDPNAWQQMRENYETIILEDYKFSEKHNIEYALWQLHYRRIEEFRAHFSAASASIGSTTSQTKSGTARSDRASKIRLQFKIFLSEATGFYHDLILKIRAKYGLPIGQFSADSAIRNMEEKDGKKSTETSKGLISCQRCLIYLGDLARYKGLYGEGESKSRDYAAASSYYMQAASLWPSSGNPHHQLAILATYSGDDLVAVYRYFRSLAVSSPFSTARDNLIVAFEKNRQHYSELQGDSKASSIKKSPVQMNGGRGKGEPTSRPKDTNFDASSSVESKPNIQTVYKAFCTRFVRLNGILFTRTSLETFGEILSLASSSLNELFSFGLEEDLSFDTDSIDNGLLIVMIVSILIFTVSNVKGEAEGQSYADIVQRTVLLQNALVAIYELMGQMFKRCLQLSDLSSSYLLPGVLVFVEWMACCPDVVVSDDMDEKQTGSRTSFWNYCISFLNKILSDGLVSVDDEETSCFTNMSRYDEGENGNQLALWEDFELRGFLPLHPSQTFLDYSRKYSVGSDSRKDKIARLKRILAAGKAITNTVKIDKKSVSFDSRLKKFVIGVVPRNLHVTATTSFESAPATNGEFRQILADSRTDVIGTEPNLPLQLEAEDEDEVIVFKPTMIEKRTDARSAKFSHRERSGHVQNATLGDSQSNGLFSTLDPKAHQQSTSDTVSQSPISISSVTPPYPMQSYQFQSSMWSTNGLVSLADDLKGLSFLDNGHTMKTGTPQELEVSNMPSLSVPIQQSIGVSASGMTYTGAKASEMMMGPVVDNANTLFGGAVPQNSVAFSGANSFSFPQNASATLPTSSRKVSANRPVRHLGPPPGFSVRPKQVNEFISGSGQNPVVDDYSWLDGYQLQSSTKSSGYMQSINQLSNLSSQSINNSNGSAGTISFPFPGKQVQFAGVQLEEENEKVWQGHQHSQSLNSRHDQLQQQQYNPLLNQQQGQSMWTGRHLV